MLVSGVSWDVIVWVRSKIQMLLLNCCSIDIYSLINLIGWLVGLSAICLIFMYYMALLYAWFFIFIFSPLGWRSSHVVHSPNLTKLDGGCVPHAPIRSPPSWISIGYVSDADMLRLVCHRYVSKQYPKYFFKANKNTLDMPRYFSDTRTFEFPIPPS